MPRVIHGANSTGEQPELAGKTVAQVRCDFKSVYNIPDEATATVNGRAATATTVLRAGDELVFAKPAGQKGQSIKIVIA